MTRALAHADADTAPSFSLIVETENVAKGGLDRLRECLRSLDRQTISPRDALDVIVPQSGDVPTATLEELQREHPWIRLLEMPPDTNYYQAKMAGARLARGELVVLADSDVAYEPDWLERLREPFRDPAVQAVAGRSSMLVDSVYTMAMSAVYFVPPRLSLPPGAKLRPGERYLAHNVAFRRRFLLDHPIPDDPAGRDFLRAQCAIHAERLTAMGTVIWEEPRARCLHPPTAPELFLWRFLAAGEEDVRWLRRTRRGPGLLPGTIRRLMHRLLEAGWRLYRLVIDQPRQLLRLPLALPLVAVALALTCAGAMSSLISPRWRPSRLLR
jgi:glycosyltransferase involved in cell wall biosynthesis